MIASIVILPLAARVRNSVAEAGYLPGTARWEPRQTVEIIQILSHATAAVPAHAIHVGDSIKDRSGSLQQIYIVVLKRRRRDKQQAVPILGRTHSRVTSVPD